MDSRSLFLAGSIADLQATIRQVDVKIAALLVVLLLPLQNLSGMFTELKDFTKVAIRWPAITIVVFFVLAWFLAFFSLIRAIAAIDNPARHVKDGSSFTGAFYLGGLYKIRFVDAFINRGGVKSNRDVPTVQAQLPASPADVETELVFEQMKLAYIRDMKLHRLYWGLMLSLIWLLLGIAIFLSSKYVID